MDQVAAVAGFADGAGGDGDDFLRAFRLRGMFETGQGRQRPVHGFIADVSAGKREATQAGRFLHAPQRRHAAVGVDLGDDHVDGVAADIDGGQTEGLAGEMARLRVTVLGR